LYDNHDAGHSKLDVDAFPQLARIEFDETAKRLGLHIGLQCRFLYNCVTFGNSSMANTSGPYWRSLPRTAYAEPRLIQALYAQYNSNQLYVYPEHRDYDPGRNGKDGFGDVYCANTPYLLVSQGSSGSDRPFLEAIACTLAAFQPDVKSFLTERGILMPTLQMIFRFCGRPLDSPQDYLTGKAQPTVFQGENIDVLKMVQMAHAMPRESIPPLVRLRVVDEDQPVVGRDYFDVAARERWFDSPSAIARIVRATQYERRMVVSAEGSYDENKRPLTWHCAVLRGDAQLIRIRRLNEAGSRVELIVPYHERRPVAFSPGIESNRVDIGFFVHNGIYYSAPAFVTFHYLDSETRVYDARKRIESVTYADTKDGGNYVDPMIELRKNWRDEYRYDPQGRLIGWTRRRGEQSQEFTADGALVTKRDPQERALEARTVSYVASPSGTTVPALEQRPGDEILHYEYSSPTDLVGRISRRSTD
jgi:YD repeat-containing protein